MKNKELKIEGVYCTTMKNIDFLVNSRGYILSSNKKYIYRILSPHDTIWTEDWDNNIEMFQSIYLRDFNKPENYIDPKKRELFNAVSKYCNNFDKPVLSYEQLSNKLKSASAKKYKKFHDLDDYLNLMGRELTLDDILVGYKISYEDPSVVAKKTEENIFSDGMTTHFRRYR